MNSYMKFICVSMLLLFLLVGISQAQNTYLQESKPLSPAAYQFLKYTGLPVSEYTGIPEVSVPVYEIKEDGIQVPISLTYHCSGITVNEEATPVGLGWNLQFGSVVQIVNDQNDLNPANTKIMPDYIGSAIPSELPLKYPWPFTSPPGPTSFPVNPPNADFTFPITTGYYFPVNGDYTIDRTNMLTSSTYDTEPDIFKANFLGYSVNFTKDFNNGGQIVVLNKVGYRVQYLTDDSWCITVPSGDQFYFALKNVTSSSAYSSSVPAVGNTSLSVTPESSVMWSLTKILTKNKREIDFNYTKTSSYKHLPNLSQTWKKASITESHNLVYTDQFRGFWNSQLSTASAGNLFTNIFYQSESHVIPASIIFPLGRVDFYTSDRNDVLGDKKIDSIAFSGDRIRQVSRFSYSYLNSSAVGGNSFAYDTTGFGNRAALRLKLNSFTDYTGGVYQFTYDPTLLPVKNSFAQDQWGYYNGTLTNTILIPNPAQYNQPTLGNNGDNHSANAPYTQASCLKQIIYPTGGSVNFDFELNSFSNYYVPDYSTSSNTVSHGNGLRIKQITWKQPDNSVAKTQQFTYTGGKALMPVSLYRNYQMPTGTGNYSNVFASAYFSVQTYFVDEYNANGYYSPSSLASINGVGYSQVTSKLVDQASNSLGSEVTNFSNNAVVLPVSSVQFMTKTGISVPGREDWNLTKNGAVQSVLYYDQLGNLKKKSSSTYLNYKSGLYYGARVNNYGNYIYYTPPVGTSVGSWDSQLQFLVSEYPIYDFESLPDTTKEVEYLAAGDSLVTTTAMQYNSIRLLSNSIKRGTNYKEETRLGYTNHEDMLADNRLSDLSYQYKSSITTTAAAPDRSPSDAHTFTRTFNSLGGGLYGRLQDVDQTVNNAGYITNYNHYDTFGNLTQVTDHNGVTGFLWSYSGKYLIAKIDNAGDSDCAYTSFEQKMLEVSGDWIVYPSLQPSARQMAAAPTYVLDGHTGQYANNAPSISSRAFTAKDHIFTLYAKGTGTITVNSIPQTISGGWKRYDWSLPNSTGVNLTTTGGILMDDFCFYPPTAQMTTYTYLPLVGLTSETDPNGKTTFYEYDNYQRLKDIKDQNGNFIKKFDYHLAGQ